MKPARATEKNQASGVCAVQHRARHTFCLGLVWLGLKVFVNHARGENENKNTHTLAAAQHCTIVLGGRLNNKIKI